MVAGGLEPVVVFWTGWGIRVMVLVSFTVQLTLLLLADIRRRKDSPLLKVIIWSAYMLADTAAIYALGHMAVVCRSPEHRLLALWAPLLLVHLGGQDNITAYAIEDNRLWLRHLQNFVLQVAAAGYVLYVSSILSHPSKLRCAAILMFVVGVLKYGERIWALKRANSCASSSLSATSYNKVVRHRTHTTTRFSEAAAPRQMVTLPRWDKDLDLLDVYSLLDVPKQMFEGPTSYVQTINVGGELQSGEYMLEVVQMQLWMMYDLLYTKAAVVHTWYGLCSRVFISLPSTVAALLLFRSSLVTSGNAAAVYYDGAYHTSGVDVTITNVLLSGAVALETMSVLRAIFSMWTAVLLMEKGWYKLASLVCRIEYLCIEMMGGLLESKTWWSGRMRQHILFELRDHSDHSVGSRIAKRVGVEDWWDSNVYSWSTDVPDLVIDKVLDLLSTSQDDMTRSQGLNTLQRRLNNDDDDQAGAGLATWIWTEEDEELKLEERILVWHIATHVYLMWFNRLLGRSYKEYSSTRSLTDYMFFLLAARPYMLPYPVSRQTYVQLCSDAFTYLSDNFDARVLLKAILNQKEALMEGTPLQPYKKYIIGHRRPPSSADRDTGSGERNTENGDAQPPPPCSMNTTLDRGCQLAAKLIHITAVAEDKTESTTTTVKGSPREQIEGQTQKRFDCEFILNMVLEVWVEMLCHMASLCNENSHARHLTDGGEIMTILTLLMIYTKNGFIRRG